MEGSFPAAPPVAPWRDPPALGRPRPGLGAAYQGSDATAHRKPPALDQGQSAPAGALMVVHMGLALPLLVSGAIVLVGTLLCVRHPAAALPHGG